MNPDLATLFGPESKAAAETPERPDVQALLAQHHAELERALQARDERRYRLVPIAPEVLVHLFTSPELLHRFEGLPADAQLVGLHWDIPMQLLYLYVCSWSYPAVPLGGVIPMTEVHITSLVETETPSVVLQRYQAHTRTVPVPCPEGQ